MILILSSSSDFSTDKIILWLNKFGIDWIRINDDEFFYKSKINISIYDDNFNFSYENHSINISDIKYIYNRRWGIKNIMDFYPNNKSDFELYENYKIEISTFFEIFFDKLKSLSWINHPENANRSKLFQLQHAKSSGLNVPKTYLSNNPDLYTPSKYITKAFEVPLSYSAGEKSYFTYTSKIKNNIGTKTTPSLIQELIVSKYEIRVFYFYKKIYSLGIKTIDNIIDYRRDNYAHKISYFPLILPKDIQKKIEDLMFRLKLETGSLDFIYSQENDYIFLEVNPYGQFDFVSNKGNYYIEKDIAQFFKNGEI